MSGARATPRARDAELFGFVGSSYFLQADARESPDWCELFTLNFNKMKEILWWRVRGGEHLHTFTVQRNQCVLTHLPSPWTPKFSENMERQNHDASRELPEELHKLLASGNRMPSMTNVSSSILERAVFGHCCIEPVEICITRCCSGVGDRRPLAWVVGCHSRKIKLAAHSAPRDRRWGSSTYSAPSVSIFMTIREACGKCRCSFSDSLRCARICDWFNSACTKWMSSARSIDRMLTLPVDVDLGRLNKDPSQDVSRRPWRTENPTPLSGSSWIVMSNCPFDVDAAVRLNQSAPAPAACSTA